MSLKVLDYKNWMIYAIVITATVANALADHFMLMMGIDVGSLWKIVDWSALQWYWHIAKWVFFNGALGVLCLILVGWKRTAWLGVAGLVTWEVTYRLAQG